MPTATDDRGILVLIQLTKLKGDFTKRESAGASRSPIHWSSRIRTSGTVDGISRGPLFASASGGPPLGFGSQ